MNFSKTPPCPGCPEAPDTAPSPLYKDLVFGFSFPPHLAGPGVSHPRAVSSVVIQSPANRRTLMPIGRSLPHALPCLGPAGTLKHYQGPALILGPPVRPPSLPLDSFGTEPSGAQGQCQLLVLRPACSYTLGVKSPILSNPERLLALAQA